MKAIHYSLSSNAYKTNIFAGFSQLQKEEEFVDLTLAADGHLVQVHRNLIALASPYLREILKSMSHHSPVIFLNNVRHEILSYLLNYIYLGEVNIPVHSVDAFIEVSKSLRITGIEDLEPPPKMKPPPKSSANRWKPPERKANVAINTLHTETINVQQLPTDIENNDNCKLESKENKKQTDIISNAKFIIQQDHSYEQNQSCNVLQNVSLVHINNENNLLDTGIDHNIIHTDITDQNQTSMETIQSMPIIEITNIDQNVQENTNYKIVVKTGPSDSNAEASNMPVLEIQPILATQELNIPQKTVPYDITPQAKDTLQKYAVQNFNLTESYTNNQEHPAHEVLQTGTGTIQPLNEKDKHIKVLDKVVIKPGVNMLEANSLDANISSNSSMDLLKNMAQFSITERGAINMILNRYMYCCHHSTRSKSRWRCVEYRRSACKAFVDTVDGVIVARDGLHAHPFHDKKIYKKHNEGIIFPTLKLAMIQRDLEQNGGLKTLSFEETDNDESAMDVQ